MMVLCQMSTAMGFCPNVLLGSGRLRRKCAPLSLYFPSLLFPGITKRGFAAAQWTNSMAAAAGGVRRRPLPSHGKNEAGNW